MSGPERTLTISEIAGNSHLSFMYLLIFLSVVKYICLGSDVFGTVSVVGERVLVFVDGVAAGGAAESPL